MASIRRTLSPYQQDRSHQNGGNTSPFSLNSPSHKHHHHHNSNSRFGGEKHTTAAAAAAATPSSRKGGGGGYRSWRRSIYSCMLFFLLGFLLGLAPFGGQLEDDDDVTSTTSTISSRRRRTPDFSFEVPTSTLLLLDDVKQQQQQQQQHDIVVDKVELSAAAAAVDSLKDVRKQLIVVTPTYNRALQAFYLNRLGQVLRLVPQPLVWIVVEMNAASTETADILRGLGIMYRHLVCTHNLTSIKDRGVHQRNTALHHIHHHKLDGIVYFADDDNVYSLHLFQAIRQISRFGTWPVAMVAQSKNKATLEGPVCNGTQVIGWHTNEKSRRLRRFHVDMSGFAFNSTILWDPKRWNKPTSALIRQLDTIKEGFQETTFIQQLVEDESQMEATPFGCSKIMNWHLHLEAHQLGYPRGWLLQKNMDAVVPIQDKQDP